LSHRPCYHFTKEPTQNVKLRDYFES